VAYAACARFGWVAALAAGFLAFGAGTALFAPVRLSLAVSVALTLAVIEAGGWWLARAAGDGVEVPDTGDLLPWRLVVTVLMVLGLTQAAHGLSPHLAGLLAPFPVITAVLGAFTQIHAGARAAVESLSGLVHALPCFLTFFGVVAATLGPLGGAGAFALATVAALGLWAVLVALSR
jgi:hypothetical protein